MKTPKTKEAGAPETGSTKKGRTSEISPNMHKTGVTTRSQAYLIETIIPLPKKKEQIENSNSDTTQHEFEDSKVKSPLIGGKLKKSPQSKKCSQDDKSVTTPIRSKRKVVGNEDSSQDDKSVTTPIRSKRKVVGNEDSSQDDKSVTTPTRSKRKVVGNEDSNENKESSIPCRRSRRYSVSENENSMEPTPTRRSRRLSGGDNFINKDEKSSTVRRSRRLSGSKVVNANIKQTNTKTKKSQLNFLETVKKPDNSESVCSDDVKIESEMSDEGSSQIELVSPKSLRLSKNKIRKSTVLPRIAEDEHSPINMGIQSKDNTDYSQKTPPPVRKSRRLSGSGIVLADNETNSSKKFTSSKRTDLKSDGVNNLLVSTETEPVNRRRSRRLSGGDNLLGAAASPKRKSPKKGKNAESEDRNKERRMPMLDSIVEYDQEIVDDDPMPTEKHTLGSENDSSKESNTSINYKTKDDNSDNERSSGLVKGSASPRKSIQLSDSNQLPLDSTSPKKKGFKKTSSPVSEGQREIQILWEEVDHSDHPKPSSKDAKESKEEVLNRSTKMLTSGSPKKTSPVKEKNKSEILSSEEEGNDDDGENETSSFRIEKSTKKLSSPKKTKKEKRELQKSLLPEKESVAHASLQNEYDDKGDDIKEDNIILMDINDSDSDKTNTSVIGTFDISPKALCRVSPKKNKKEKNKIENLPISEKNYEQPESEFVNAKTFIVELTDSSESESLLSKNEAKQDVVPVVENINSDSGSTVVLDNSFTTPKKKDDTGDKSSSRKKINKMEIDIHKQQTLTSKPSNCKTIMREERTSSCDTVVLPDNHKQPKFSTVYRGHVKHNDRSASSANQDVVVENRHSDSSSTVILDHSFTTPKKKDNTGNKSSSLKKKNKMETDVQKQKHLSSKPSNVNTIISKEGTSSGETVVLPDSHKQPKFSPVFKSQLKQNERSESSDSDSDAESRKAIMESAQKRIIQNLSTSESESRKFVRPLAKFHEQPSDSDSAPEQMSFNAGRQQTMESLKNAVESINKEKQQKKEKRKQRLEKFRQQKEEKLIRLKEKRASQEDASCSSSEESGYEDEHGHSVSKSNKHQRVKREKENLHDTAKTKVKKITYSEDDGGEPTDRKEKKRKQEQINDAETKEKKEKKRKQEEKEIPHNLGNLRMLPSDVLESLPDEIPHKFPKLDKEVSKEKRRHKLDKLKGKSHDFRSRSDIDYIPLNSGSSTQFGVMPLDTLSRASKSLAEQAAEWKQNMLYGSRIQRGPANAHFIYQQKLKASGKDRFVR